MHLRVAYRRRRCSRIEAVLAFFQVVASSQISPPFRARSSAHETHPQNYKKKSIPPNFPPNSRYPPPRPDTRPMYGRDLSRPMPPRIGPQKLPRHSHFLIADLRRWGPRRSAINKKRATPYQPPVRSLVRIWCSTYAMSPNQTTLSGSPIELLLLPGRFEFFHNPMDFSIA